MPFTTPQLVRSLAPLIFFLAPAIAIARPPASHPALATPDTACRSCHQSIYDSYQKTSMANASGLASDGLDLPDKGAHGFRHEPSGVTYRIVLRDGQPFLTYGRAQTEARPGLTGEDRLEFFIGSGKRGRTLPLPA